MMNLEKRIVKECLTGVLILIGAVVVGMILLVVAYCFPSKIIIQNVDRGTSVYDSANEYPYWADGYLDTTQDYFTDAIMLQNAVYSSGNAFQDTLTSPRYLFGGDGGVYDLISAVHGENPNRTISYYARYWHGYLIVLKPLLTFFDLSDIRVMNAICQLLLIFTCLYELTKVHNPRLLLAFTALMAVWSPVTIGMSFQYASCLYITLLAILAVLKMSIYRTPNYIYMFLITGIMTSYFDFLTFPLATLGIPLILVLLLYTQTGKTGLGRTLHCSFWWFFGYIGMWLSKWALATMFTDINVIGDALNEVGVRTSLDDGNISRIATIIKNISILKRWPYLLLAVLIVFVIASYSEKKAKRHTTEKRNMRILISIAVVCLYPFIWYICVPNHSWHHLRMAYRELGITCFGGIIILQTVIEYMFSMRRKWITGTDGNE